nr:hypothetical protein [uncultured Rhodopila sp.]
MDIPLYTLRNRAWKMLGSAAKRLHDTDDDTETILGAVEQQVRLIRQELAAVRESRQEATRLVTTGPNT